MTPQERDLLTNLVNRLRQAPQQQRDQEAEAMINDLVRERPDTPYVLAQTVLIQDYSLHQAQARIAELEQQLKGQQGQQEGGGFLSSIFGGSKPAQGAPRPQAQAQATYQQPAYAPPPSGGPWGQSPAYGPAQQVFAQAPSQPSFLRSAATTAAGVAGGALLFEGIESLLGGHGGYGNAYGAGFGGGFGPQPGLTETVINNYYEEPARDSQPDDVRDTNYDTSGSDSGDYTDASYDDGGDSSGGGDDFGGTDV